jgi:cyclic pyranopterin phosphate synthase
MEKEAVPREINYLRMSITDRCQLRCFYCTYWQQWQKLPYREILNYEELLRIAGIAAKMGIRKVRVTGGEPLVRRGVVGFLHRLHQVPGIEKVCLTTNGVLLADLASALYDTGLRHLNLSLDTLRRERYREITGKDNLGEVLAGLERAETLGFRPLKINCVVMAGINDDELMELALLARDHPYQVRFIELMPTVSTGRWRRHFLPMEEVRRCLAGLGPLEAVRHQATNGPAQIFRLPGFRGELGFITPMSSHHCQTCNRLRLTAAGALRPCLFGDNEIDVKNPLRQGASEGLLASVLAGAIRQKIGRPDCPPGDFPLHAASMVSIGG